MVEKRLSVSSPERTLTLSPSILHFGQSKIGNRKSAIIEPLIPNP